MDLCFASASEMARLVRCGEASSAELLAAVLAQIDRINNQLNAVVQLDREGALAQAREADRAVRRRETLGLLHGVPITLKDTLDAKGMVCSSGTLGRAHFRSRSDAVVATRLRNAGAIVIGKTNVPEFGLAVETDNLIYGRTNNPYDVTRSAGGSSGGAACAVAAGFSALDMGSDGGGSIRLPAHFCGIAALKATTGRIPQTGHFPAAVGPGARLAALGPMARKVADLRLSLQIVEGEDLEDPLSVFLPGTPSQRSSVRGLRTAFYVDDGVSTPDPQIASILRTSVTALKEQGCLVSEARLPRIADACEIHLGFVVLDRHLIRDWIQEASTTSLHPWVVAGLAYLEEAATDQAPDFATRLFEELTRYQRDARCFMKDYDVVVSPVSASAAPKHGYGVLGGSHAGYGYSVLHNVTGWPSAVVRCGQTADGLPLNLQVAALPFREDLVLNVAEVLEESMGGYVAPVLQ